LNALVRREVEFRRAVGQSFSKRESDILRVLRTAAAVVMRGSVDGTCGTSPEQRLVYSSHEASGRLRVSDRYLREHAERFGGRKVGRTWVFDADDIELERSARIRDGRLRGNIGDVGA
jgi:hypothetical protein